MTATDPPVANPPAPDVEARPDMLLAYRLGHLAVWIGPSRWSDAGGKKWQADAVLREAISELAALTAHTASLQARVEELERQVQSAEGVISTFQHANNLYREAMDERTTFKNQARAAEAEANRMREAGERLRDALGSSFHVLHLAACEMVAALRPADEPVTQREM